MPDDVSKIIANAPASGEKSPDAKLLALYALWQVSYRAEIAAHIAVARIEEAHSDDLRVSIPKALWHRPSDEAELHLGNGQQHFSGRLWFSPLALVEMDEHLHNPNRPCHARADNRRREIIEAHEAYAASIEEARQRVGLAQAEDERDRLEDQNRGYRTTLTMTPARTMAGLVAKMHVAFSCFRHSQPLVEELAYDVLDRKGPCGEQVALSAVADACRILLSEEAQSFGAEFFAPKK